jgi:hypothetical protein
MICAIRMEKNQYIPNDLLIDKIRLPILTPSRHDAAASYAAQAKKTADDGGDVPPCQSRLAS